MVLCVVCLLWEPVYRAVTKREPSLSYVFEYDNWSDTETVALYDLHENDRVTYQIGHMDGWIDVWIENVKGEMMTEVSTSGTTELVIPERGHYILRIVGEHAHASVKLFIDTAP